MDIKREYFKENGKLFVSFKCPNCPDKYLEVRSDFYQYGKKSTTVYLRCPYCSFKCSLMDSILTTDHHIANPIIKFERKLHPENEHHAVSLSFSCKNGKINPLEIRSGPDEESIHTRCTNTCENCNGDLHFRNSIMNITVM